MPTQNLWSQRKRKPARAIVPFSHFVNATVFAMKRGGYGCFMALDGLDHEGVTDQELISHVATIRAARKSIAAAGGQLYEYQRIRRGFPMPVQKPEADGVAEGFVRDRVDHLGKTANFHRIELFWCVTVDTAKSRTPQQHARNSAAALQGVGRAVEALTAQLGSMLGLRVASKDEAFAFFGHLLNLEEWAMDRRLAADTALDQQIVNSTIQWHKEHLKIGRRHVQMMSLLPTPATSRPNLFGALQSIDADLIVCSCWSPEPASAVRKRIGQVEFFKTLFRHNVAKVASHLGDMDKLDQSIEAKADVKNTEKRTDLLTDLDDGYTSGKYSLTVLVHSVDENEVYAALPQVHRVFTDANAAILEETRGNLAAYYAMLPGNSSGDATTDFNVRKFWLRDDHAAELSFAFAPYTGSQRSDDLNAPYLLAYETRTNTPFFLDPYVNGNRNTLVLGATRSGKSVNGNLMLAHEQKYGGFSYVFDVGGSYESTVLALGGVVERISVGNPRFALFSEAPTVENLIFLFGLIRLLLVAGGAQLTPEDESAITPAIKRMYDIPQAVRRLRNLMLPPHLVRYLAKWIKDGAYAATFDNVEDSLRFARVQCFDFEAVTDSQQDLIEPLLFFLLHRINGVMRDPANLGVPKHILFDELWKHLKSRQLLEMALDALKTGGKHLVGATLLTQSAGDLGANADLIINACSTVMFLQDPTFNREHYRKLFNLHDQDLANIGSLMRYEFYLKRAEFGKICKTTLDARSLWMFSTKPKDKVRRAAEIQMHGFEGALERVGK